MRTILGGLRRRIPRPTPALSVGVLALLIACSGAAVAAGSYTATDGTITACRDNKTGALRVIDAASQSCGSSKETKLTWKDGFPGSTVDNAANADK